MSEAEIADRESRTIGHDLSCMICGYNLRGLQTAGACPECGTDVGRSLQGDLLKFADQSWLGGVYNGTRLLGGANLLLVICLLAFILMPFLIRSPQSTGTAAIVIVFVTVLRVLLPATILFTMIGAWLITRQEPRLYLAEEVTSSRILARASVLLMLISCALAYAYPGMLRPYVRVVMLISFVVALMSCLRHLTAIGRRIPEQKLVEQARKRQKGIFRIGIALGLFYAAHLITSVLPSAPKIAGTVSILAFAFVGLVLFFNVMSAIGILGRFRPVLKRVLVDARAA